jgi:anaerobic selenocysteine-containing dehydrogenase
VPKKKKDEFILTTFKSNLWAKGTANSKWAREILHENRLWINKDVAHRLGIKNGDRVRVTSSVGSLISRVLTTHRIHPESVAIAEGLGHSAVGNVAKARRFRSNDLDTNLIWWGRKGNGMNPNEIIERRVDPMGGGLGLKDTRVRIERI